MTSKSTQPEVICYQLRHPAQVPFAATRPGAIIQIREVARRASRPAVTLAASLLVAMLVTAVAVAGTPKSRLAPACLRDGARASACQLISSYFDALNTGQGEKACSLLGSKLRLETGGPSCPSVLAMSRGTPFQIVGARSVRAGVAVLVKVGFHEFDHFRMLRWVAIVGRETGQVRILKTRRV
jgi:hypothetical protein